MGIVNGGSFSLRQKIFKGKIIFLVCCFRRTIKTVFSYVPPGFLGWGGMWVLGEGFPAPLPPQAASKSAVGPHPNVQSSIREMGNSWLRPLQGAAPGEELRAELWTSTGSGLTV